VVALEANGLEASAGFFQRLRQIAWLRVAISARSRAASMSAARERRPASRRRSRCAPG
jgi:hypothetical protein